LPLKLAKEAVFINVGRVARPSIWDFLKLPVFDVGWTGISLPKTGSLRAASPPASHPPLFTREYPVRLAP